MLAGRSRRRAAIVAGALAGVLTPLAAHAATGLVLSLQLAPGAAGATQSVDYLTPLNSNADVPVYLYATVTGTTSVTAAAAYQGFQYAFYNILDANAPGSGVGVTPTLDTATTKFNTVSTNAFNFAANGTTIGSTANGASGILAGSTTVLSDVAFARSASDGPVWNTAGSSPNVYVSPSGTSVSFLVETLNVKPTAFLASTRAPNGQNYSKFSVSIPAIGIVGGSEYKGANWNQDSTSNVSNGSPGSIQNGAYSGSTSFVTFEDTEAGDTDGNGTVDINDLGQLAFNYNKFPSGGATWAQGDFDGNGKVDINDLGALAFNYNHPLTGIPPTVSFATALAEVEASDPSFAAALAGTQFAAVPEPTTLGLIGIAGIGLLRRRRKV